MNSRYTVVFSAWRANQDLITNMEASKQARTFLDDLALPHWDAIGAFKEAGQTEHFQEVSHVVHCDSFQELAAVEKYAFDVHNQDCVLVINSNGNMASLSFPEGCKAVGELCKVDKDTARHNEAYTYFLGDYYICQ